MLNIIKKFCSEYNIDYKFIKFLFVGSFNTLVGYLVYSFFIFIGIHYSISALFSTIFGIIFNFFTTSKLVFKNSKLSLFFKFFAVYVFCWYIAVIFIHFYKIFIGNNEYLAGFIILFPNAIISYTLMKYYVFKSNNKNSL